MTFLLLSYKVICLTFSFNKNKREKERKMALVQWGTWALLQAFREVGLPKNYEILEICILCNALFHENRNNISIFKTSLKLVGSTLGTHF